MPVFHWCDAAPFRTPAEKLADRRRPVNQGKGRGITKPPVRKHRKRR